MCFDVVQVDRRRQQMLFVGAGQIEQALDIGQYVAGLLFNPGVEVVTDLPGQKIGGMAITAADDFAYRDPVDGSESKGQGLRVIGMDFRGHGQSEGQRGHTPSYDQLLNSVDDLLNKAQEFFPEATKALDFAEYLIFQTGLFIAENFVIADSVLFE